MPPLAHAGHWLVQIAYFLPVVMFLIWLGVTVLRDRRSESESGAPEVAPERPGLTEEPSGGDGHETHPPAPHAD